MEQLISHTKTALTDTIADGRVIPVQKVLKLLTKIHDILDNAMSMWVGNAAQILASVFNSPTR